MKKTFEYSRLFKINQASLYFLFFTARQDLASCGVMDNEFPPHLFCTKECVFDVYIRKWNDYRYGPFDSLVNLIKIYIFFLGAKEFPLLSILRPSKKKKS